MRPLCLLLTAALLLAQAAPLGASQHCGRLEYWNPDYRCCGSCLQRFGPPPCPDFEFSETAGSMTLAITCRAPSKSVLLGSATPTVRSNVAPVAPEPRPLPPRGARAAEHSGAAERLPGGIRGRGLTEGRSGSTPGQRTAAPGIAAPVSRPG